MPLLEIVIFKSRGGRDLRDQFSNTYLFSGEPNYVSQAAFNMVSLIATAEAYIFFDNTFFIRGIIRQLNDQGEYTKGETRSVPLTAAGTRPMPAGATDVPEDVVVCIAKQVLVGRAGLQSYRFALTSDEYNAYIEAGTAPARIVTSDPAANPPVLSFTQQLANLAVDSGLAMILPISETYANGAPRPITSFTFEGIRTRQGEVQKGSTDGGLVSSVQAVVNENGRKVKKMLDDYTDLPVGAVGLGAQLMAIIQELVASARSFVNGLPIRLQAQITWPPVYADIRIVWGA